MPNRIFIRFPAPIKATSAALNRLSKIISFKIEALLVDPLNQNDHLLLEYTAESVLAHYTYESAPLEPKSTRAHNVLRP